MTAKLRSQTFKVARFSVRRQVNPDDTGEVERHPGSGSTDVLEGVPSVSLGKKIRNDKPREAGIGGRSETSTIS